MLPVCMKYTARGESRVANIAQGYICHETLINSCILSYKRIGSALSVLLYFTLEDVLTEDILLKFITHLMNKQMTLMCFFDRNVLVES